MPLEIAIMHDMWLATCTNTAHHTGRSCMMYLRSRASHKHVPQEEELSTNECRRCHPTVKSMPAVTATCSATGNSPAHQRLIKKSSAKPILLEQGHVLHPHASSDRQ